MKAELHRNGGEGPRREELRAWLRQWDVAAPPAEIEEDLREAFRQHRPSRRLAHWLVLAAAAVLIALWWIGSRGRLVTPAPAGTPVAVASPAPPAASVQSVRAPAPAAAPTPASVAPALGRGEPASRPVEVIVEPGQADLLAELCHRLQAAPETAYGAAILSTEEARATAPAATVPAMEETRVPPYQGRWETVAGEWPYVRVLRPGR